MKIYRTPDSAEPIICEAEWPQPKKSVQWQDGKSAKESARFWLQPDAPQQIQSQLDGFFPGLVLEAAFPEFVTKFDAHRFPRQHDLMIKGTWKQGPMVIGLEAKVAEPFGNHSVQKYYAQTQQKQGSKVPERLEALTAALFYQGNTPTEFNLRYQLLHATGGLMAYAKDTQASDALFLVQIFETGFPKGKRSRHQKNLDDWQAFVKALAPQCANPVSAQAITGPYRIPGNDYISSQANLYLGLISSPPAPRKEQPQS